MKGTYLNIFKCTQRPTHSPKISAIFSQVMDLWFRKGLSISNLQHITLKSLAFVQYDENMMKNSEKTDYKLKSLKLSMKAISSVVIVEISLGLAVSSLAILSDGLHALLDALTTFVLLITTRAALKPPDEEHMYGHEKFESLGGLIGGMALIGVAALIMFESILKIMQNAGIRQGLEFAGFIAIGYTFCIDFFRVGLLRKAIRSESSTMKAGLYHAISDLSSTIIALLGFSLATRGVYYGDSAASMVLSVLLASLSVRLVLTSGMELSDAISKDVVRKVRREILSAKGVFEYERLKVRKSGEKFFITATLKVPDYLGLEEAHEIAEKIESNIKNALGNAEINFHIEPKGTKEMPTEKLIEKLALEVRGVKEAHGIVMAYTEGELYVTLHAQVDPKISIREAHEIAEKIENKVSRNIENLENVTVHIEPFSPEQMKAFTVDENDIRRIVQRVAGDRQQRLHIKRIVTYVADGKRYINIDCVFGGMVSLEGAHDLASQIEGQVKERFEETMVTVHIEPETREQQTFRR